MGIMPLPLPVVSLWDPRASSSGSIDPLGALRAYNAIAGFLLPGVTTITTRVRYLSWLCAGLRLLDDVGDAPAGGTAGRSRRQRLLPWERLLVLATGYHASSAGDASDAPSWQWLRGISYVRRAIEQGATSIEFELLSNQAGVGGVGTYWVSMVKGGLVDDASAELTHRGIVLADAFLKGIGTHDGRKLSRIVAGESPTFRKDDLIRWGKIVSLDVSRASSAEVCVLRDALLEPKTQRCLSTAIDGGRNAWSRHDAFKRIERALKTQGDEIASRIAAVMTLTRAFETVHAGLLDQFDRLRSLDGRGTPVDRKQAANALNLSGHICAHGYALSRCLDQLSEVPGEIASPVRQFLASVQSIINAESKDRFLVEICSHHERVQSGKLDASRQPKLPWISLKANELHISPRFAIEPNPEPCDPQAFTHRYRVESFAGMLSEVDAARCAA